MKLFTEIMGIQTVVQLAVPGYGRALMLRHERLVLNRRRDVIDTQTLTVELPREWLRELGERILCWADAVETGAEAWKRQYDPSALLGAPPAEPAPGVVEAIELGAPSPWRSYDGSR